MKAPYKALAGYFLALFLLMMPAFAICLSQLGKSAEQSGCGKDPLEDRSFSKQQSRPQIPETALVAVYRHGTESRILISRHWLDGKGGSLRRAYSSSDHGESWKQDIAESANYGNLDTFYGRLTGIADHQNSSVRWYSEDWTTIQLSLNGERSWEKIVPALQERGEIERIELIGAGKHNEGTLYSGISLKTDAANDDNYAVCRSDDYSRTFVIVSSDVLYAVESAANPNLMIGVDRPRVGLDRSIVISEDSGKTWKKTPTNVVTVHVDQYSTNFRPVRQIEADPTDADTFYVVTWTGLYATHDRGKTFRLLPLANEYVFGVDTIAVDPVDARFIYAVVMGKDLYRSADRGCIWEKLPLLNQQ